jgi:hypothetical protein
VYSASHILLWRELSGIPAYFFVITGEAFKIDFLPFLQCPCRTTAVSDRQLCPLPRAVFYSTKYPFSREHHSSLDVCFTVRFVHDYVNIYTLRAFVGEFYKSFFGTSFGRCHGHRPEFIFRTSVCVSRCCEVQFGPWTLFKTVFYTG